MAVDTRSAPDAETSGPDDAAAGTAWKRVLVVIALTVGAVLVNGVFSVVPALFLSGLSGFAGLIVLGELGFLAVGLGFLVATGRGLAYLDVTVPSARQVGGYLLGGAAVLFGLRTALVVILSTLGVTPAESSLLTTEFDIQAVLLILIPASVLVIGPCEELLFRGVIQKYLDGAVSTTAAIGVAALLFGLIHLPTLAMNGGLVGPLATTGVLVLVGAGFGWLYARTDSLPVAMGVHGLYNTAIFATAYAAVVMDLGAF